MMEKPGEVNALLLAFAAKTGVAKGTGASTSGALAP